MRTVPPAWLALELSRERQPALLIHIYAVPGGRVQWDPDEAIAAGWGSWCYSVGFQYEATMPDIADYAQDWDDPNTPRVRTYVPGAIEYDAKQPFRVESVNLDPHDIMLKVDPTMEPFADYVSRQWPITFGIVIYKVFRNGNALAQVDDGTNTNTNVTVVDVAFVGFLNADDELETNSAGLELTIDGGQEKLETRWNHITKIFDREIPRPVISIDCPKLLFSTGDPSVACNASMPYVQTDGLVLQQNGCVISALEWGVAVAGWFGRGLATYTATEPLSGLSMTISLRVTTSAPRVSGGNTYGDLTLEMFPPLPILGASVSAFGGCNRQKPTCISKHLPAGSPLPTPGSFNPGTLRVTLQLFNTFDGAGTHHPAECDVTILPGGLFLTYFGGDPDDHVQNIFVGPGTGNPFDPTWVNAAGVTNKTVPSFDLAGAGVYNPQAMAGYHVVLSNSGGANAKIKQQPTTANGYATVIKCSGGTPGSFDFTVAFTADNGTPISLGNLQNFGGTDSPIEHPSLETTQ